ncbi:MAG TPA: riboflavin synthase [Chitinophagaceae bacterium]|nr:riboflavin synthase [Chitinophagaceae bacterium]
MFTGIIETIGTIKEVVSNGSNQSFWIESLLSSQLKADQSVSHNGICLTVEEIQGEKHKVTAVTETIKKTTIGSWVPGMNINIERCLRLHDRLDGHIVQGHVDTTLWCKKRNEKKGSWEFEFELSKKFAPLIIEKGSICINGVSLTAFNVKKKSFTVTIIPYTFEHTTINEVQKNTLVNVEFDLVGKYLLRRLSLSEGLPRRRRNN